MSFMELYIYPKGSTYSADCDKCGQTVTIHEWITDSFNDDRDAIESGKAHCPECSGRLDPATMSHGRMYAGRYSADGYMDCTDWSYDTNKRRLERELRCKAVLMLVSLIQFDDFAPDIDQVRYDLIAANPSLYGT